MILQNNIAFSLSHEKYPFPKADCKMKSKIVECKQQVLHNTIEDVQNCTMIFPNLSILLQAKIEQCAILIKYDSEICVIKLEILESITDIVFKN